MPTARTSFGWRAEELARSFLERRGMRFVERHFRTRQGEIDLIMEDGKTLVFVEVKSRRNRRFGIAEEAVDERKIERMRSTVETYLQRHPWKGEIRMDVVVNDRGNIRYLRGV